MVSREIIYSKAVSEEVEIEMGRVENTAESGQQL